MIVEGVFVKIVLGVYIGCIGHVNKINPDYTMMNLSCLIETSSEHEVNVWRSDSNFGLDNYKQRNLKVITEEEHGKLYVKGLYKGK